VALGTVGTVDALGKTDALGTVGARGTVGALDTAGMVGTLGGAEKGTVLAEDASELPRLGWETSSWLELRTRCASA
jgi:hypothetical protein